MSVNKINYLVVFLYYSFLFEHFRFSLPVPYVLPLFILMVFLNIRYLLRFRVEKTLFIFLIFFFYSLLSLFYSLDKVEAMQRNISLGLMIAFLMIIYKQLEKQYIVVFLKHATILGVIYILLNFIMYDSLLDYKGQLEGLTGNRHNSSILFGLYFIIIFVYSNFVSLRTKVILYLVLLVDIYLIFMTFGRIGLYFIGLFFIFYGVYRFKETRHISKIFIIVVIIVAAVYLTPVLLDNVFIQYMIERGLTGRDIISSSLIDAYLKNTYVTFTGFGAGSLEDIGRVIFEYLGIHGTVRDTNNFVAILIEYGLIGVFIFCYIFIKYFYCLFYLFRAKCFDCYFIGIIPVGLVLNISESNWINFNSFSTILMFVFVLFVFKQYRQLLRYHSIKKIRH